MKQSNSMVQQLEVKLVEGHNFALVDLVEVIFFQCVCTDFSHFVDEFIHIAEKSSLILPLTLWTLNTALRQSAAICNQHRNFLVAVNMSASILDKDIVDLVMGAVQTWDVPAHQLVLEVTENAIMEKPVTCLQTLKQLRSHNIILSIDDFGTGYFSFSYLKRLPVQELKIDQSFVKDMIRNANDAHIVQAMLDLGRTFGLKVIAEGIEDRKQTGFLLVHHCAFGQGQLYSRPLAINELREHLGAGQAMIA